MKQFSHLSFILFLFVFNLNAQNTTESKDEQGLEVPKNLVLEQDKNAYREAIKTWYTKDKRENPNRADWFGDAKFGCFIHWGVYSTAAGEWNGKGTLGYAEHLMRARKIPLAEYKEKLVKTFDPKNFDADKWMKMAKETGMKYFIITAKHHDGFAMYPSDAYNYDIRLTNCKGDPMKDLRLAAKKYGIKFGFYYSHAFDWEHPDAPGNDWDYRNPGGDSLLHGGANWWETFPEFLPKAQKYVDEKSIPQILELIKNYDPEILWFDTPQKLPFYMNLQITKAIREANPKILLNGRLAKVAKVNFGDYNNSGDRPAVFRPVDGLWEALPTTNESYGYNKFDLTHKTPKHFVQMLASASAKGGNLLMNVGPMGDGTWDEKDIRIFSTVGVWLKNNGESIYNTRRNPITLQSWGEITTKGKNLYLHVFNYPNDQKLIVGGLGANKFNAYFLIDDKKVPLKAIKINATDWVVMLPKKPLDSLNTVIKLVCDTIYNNELNRLISSSEPNILQVFDAATPGRAFAYGDGKKNNEFVRMWQKNDQNIEWKFRNNENLEAEIGFLYNTAKKDENGSIVIEIDGKSNILSYKATNALNQPQKLSIPNVALTAGMHVIRLKLDAFTGFQAMQPLHLEINPVKKLLFEKSKF